jgi:hypothetical protein
LNGLEALRGRISVEVKWLKISDLSEGALNPLQQFVVFDEVTTRSIVGAYRK